MLPSVAGTGPPHPAIRCDTPAMRRVFRHKHLNPDWVRRGFICGLMDRQPHIVLPERARLRVGGNKAPKIAKRARIVLIGSDGHGGMAILRKTGVSKPAVWRSGRRFSSRPASRASSGAAASHRARSRSALRSTAKSSRRLGRSARPAISASVAASSPAVCNFPRRVRARYPLRSVR